jgi:hypothetical protein
VGDVERWLGQSLGYEREEVPAGAGAGPGAESRA